MYTYIGYPILLIWLSKCSEIRISKSPPMNLPRVTVLIAAKDEEANVLSRLDNLLSQNFPYTHLDIIVVSDGSRDKTDNIIAEYIDNKEKDTPSIKLISLEVNEGKPNALNIGIEHANGDIIVFTDTRQNFKENAIQELVRNFTDPTVGCVSGELLFLKNSDTNIEQEMGLYWNLEKLIRKLESKIGSVPGATGAIYAIRRELFQKLPPETLIDDVVTPMNIVLQGYRSIFDSNARAYDVISPNIQIEWQRKVRTLAGNWQLFSLCPEFFHPLKNPIWWKFLSHKFFRLIIPFFLPLVFASALLAEGLVYSIMVWLQILFYLMALSGWLLPKCRTLRIVNLSFFFSTLNLAAFSGFLYWVMGNCDKAWKSAKTTGEEER